MKKYSYNTETYDLKNKIQELFGYKLENLHDDSILDVVSREKDQMSKYHSVFYDWARTKYFQKIYLEFIKNEIKPLYNSEIVYQTIPTFRISFMNNIAVGEFHKDKNYRDLDWAESVKEDNFFIPITDAFNTNTIWAESEEDKGDFSPMNCEYGSFIKWDGSNLTHGNKINNTGKVRVSFDFRVIKIENYKPSDYGSINMNSKFKIGGYYSKM
jgi:hypothetical protein